MDFRHRGINNKDYKIFSDRVHKEKVLRANWNEKYDRLKDHSENEFSWQGACNQIEFEEFMKKHQFKETVIPLTEKKSDFTNDVNEYLEKLGVRDKRSKKLTPIFMYDADKEEKDLIYKGISRDHEGRYQYLKERRKHSPEKKYAFPITSSMDIGWRVYDDKAKLSSRFLKESKEIDNSTSFKSTSLGVFPSSYAIKNEVKNSFYRDNGVLNDQWKDDVIKARSS